jgi:hypothetical protein
MICRNFLTNPEERVKDFDWFSDYEDTLDYLRTAYYRGGKSFADRQEAAKALDILLEGYKNYQLLDDRPITLPVSLVTIGKLEMLCLGSEIIPLSNLHGFELGPSQKLPTRYIVVFVKDPQRDQVEKKLYSGDKCDEIYKFLRGCHNVSGRSDDSTTT